jgi:hypothetical protein
MATLSRVDDFLELSSPITMMRGSENSPSEDDSASWTPTLETPHSILLVNSLGVSGNASARFCSVVMLE